MPATTALTALVAALSMQHAPVAKISTPPTRIAAMTCFKTGEETSGQNKLCYYDCAGSRAAITIGLAQLCPLTIRR